MWPISALGAPRQQLAHSASGSNLAQGVHSPAEAFAICVHSIEMDKARMDTSPSKDSFIEVHAVYHHLGRAANRIARWLRKRGYAAQAGHPLNGVALYPSRGQRAGLGWRGLHGLLITPRFGPRVRLAAVFTSIKNLPFCWENPHSWIEGYCDACQLCAKECPPQAILEQPIENSNGLVTCTVNERCFPYFMDNYGCSICIRVCPVSERGLRRAEEGNGVIPGACVKNP